MNLHNPDFPRHKILLGDSIKPQYRNKKQDASYFARNGFGFQRLKLAQFVSNQLNEKHKNDAAILEKFRKQAEEYKKSLRKNNSYRSQVMLKAPPEMINTPIEIQKIKTEESEEEEVRKPEKVVLREIGVETDDNHRKLIKELKKKEKELKMKDKVIKGSQSKIKELSHRLRKMQHVQMQKEVEESRKFENESIVKIKELVSSMSDRLNENSHLLENRKFAVNTIEKERQKTPIQKQVKKPLPKPIKKLSEPPKYSIEERPIVSYVVKNEEEAEKEKSDLNSYVKNLSYNRSRLESLRNPEENEF